MKILHVNPIDNGIECLYVSEYGSYETYNNQKEVNTILEAVSKMQNYSIAFKEDAMIVTNNKSVIYFNNYKELFDNPIVSRFYQEKKAKIKKANKKKKCKTIQGIAIITAGCIGVFGLCSFNSKKNEKSNQNNYATSNIGKIANDTDEYIVQYQEGLKNIQELGNVTSDVEKTTNEIELPEMVDLEYEDFSNTDKAMYAKENYQEIISKYANMYGLDPDLMLALATQERGYHSETIDSTAIGLMQIEYNVWNNQNISAYNFEDQNQKSFKINGDLLGDLNYNIEVSCMIFQNCLKQMDYNLLAALQCYNFGYGNIMTVLKQYANDNNKTVDEVLNDNQDIGWIDYLSMINQGDPNYITNVLKWVGNDLNYNVLKEDGTEVFLYINQTKQR